MRTTLLFHIAAGGLGLLSGFTALYATKGATLHRRAGTVFVYATLAMSFAGMTIAIVSNVAPAVNVPAAGLTAALVISSLTTLRETSVVTRWLNLASTLTVFAVGVVSLSFAVEAFANGGTRGGMPAFPFVMFGVVGLLAGAGDLRVLRSGPLRGRRRLSRHLWRMCFALFIAALSFFIGQAKVFPEPVRIMPLLATPVLAVLVTMFVWLWRVRAGRSLHRITQGRRSESVGETPLPSAR